MSQAFAIRPNDADRPSPFIVPPQPPPNISKHTKRRSESGWVPLAANEHTHARPLPAWSSPRAWFSACTMVSAMRSSVVKRPLIGAGLTGFTTVPCGRTILMGRKQPSFCRMSGLVM